MDPSVLLKSPWRAQWPDPVEDRKKLLTLRDLMDQRRIREQQYQLQQQAMQEHQRKLADDERYRQALTGGIPADLTLDEAVRRYGPQGFDVYNSIRTSRTAEDNAKTATLTRQQKEAELVRKRMQDRADVLYSVQGQGQPATDEAVMMDLLKPKDQQLGLGKIGQETPLALTEPQMRSQYSEAYSPTQWQALKKGETDAQTADLKQDDERFKAVYPLIAGASDQDAWTAAIKTAPIQYQRLFPPRFNAANKQKALSMWVPPGEAARLAQQVPNSPDEIITWMNQPERTPDEKAQGAKTLETMSNYHAKIAEAMSGAKPMSAEASKVSAIAESMIPEARLLQEAIRKGGRKALLAIMTKSDPTLSRLADSVADKLGRLRSGGAVNAGEEARFMAQLARWADLLSSNEDMSAPIDAIERIIGEANTVSGRMRPGQPPPAGATQQPSAQQTGPAPTVPLNDVLLKPGEVVNGYRYLGGDRKKKDSYQKVN
jgi:hypothetical protein